MRRGVNKKKIKSFGKKLATIRKEKNITQEELSHRSGISLSQIARIETGVINTTLNTILIISDTLGISPKELFD